MLVFVKRQTPGTQHRFILLSNIFVLVLVFVFVLVLVFVFVLVFAFAFVGRWQGRPEVAQWSLSLGDFPRFAARVVSNLHGLSRRLSRIIVLALIWSLPSGASSGNPDFGISIGSGNRIEALCDFVFNFSSTFKLWAYDVRVQILYAPTPEYFQAKLPPSLQYLVPFFPMQHFQFIF